MLIRKVIRYYFLFVMGLVAVSASAYVGTNEHYFGSVFNIQDDFVSETNEVFELLSAHKNLGGVKFMRVGGTFVTPGQTNFKVAEIIITGKDATIAMKNLAFKTTGTTPGFIKNLRLKSRETVLVGEREGRSFEFNQMDYLVAPGESVKFDVLVDLSENLSAGARGQIEIDKPSDLFVLANGRPYSVYSYYPVDIKHLTAAGSRL